MTKRFDHITATACFLIAIMCFGALFAGCSDVRDQTDPAAVLYNVDGTVIHEIHPKTNITCFVVYNSGISCLKD